MKENYLLPLMVLKCIYSSDFSACFKKKKKGMLLLKSIRNLKYYLPLCYALPAETASQKLTNLVFVGLYLFISLAEKKHQLYSVLLMSHT